MICMPSALGLWACMSGKLFMPMLQVLLNVWGNYDITRQMLTASRGKPEKVRINRSLTWFITIWMWDACGWISWRYRISWSQSSAHAVTMVDKDKDVEVSTWGCIFLSLRSLSSLCSGVARSLLNLYNSLLLCNLSSLVISCATAWSVTWNK